MLTADRVNELLIYDEETGVFYWRVARSNRVKVGAVAGSVMIGPRKYTRIRIDSKWYYAHRLAWMVTYGEMPSTYLDHINGDCQDNRVCNLRPVTNAQNSYNSKIRSSNKAGYKGVHFNGTKYIACITPGGVSIHLGCFDSPELAHLAYCDAADKYFGEYANYGGD